MQDLANVTVRKGETAELICLAAGDAMPHIRFMKTINDTEYEVVTLKEFENRISTDTISTSIKTYKFFKRYLWIYNVTFADAGKYTCKAGNSIGTTKKDVYLIVEEKPIGENRILFSVRRLDHLVTVMAAEVFLKYCISSFAHTKNSCTGSVFFLI